MAGSAMSMSVFLLCLFASVHGMSNSKLSIHTGFENGGPNSWDIVQNGQPRVIKLLDEFDPAAQIKQDVPGIAIVGRIYLENQPQTGDPNQAAQAWWNLTAPTIMAYPAVDYWEGYNEPYVSDLSSMQWYASFEVARTKLLQSNGKKAAIGSFATGTPDCTNSDIMEAWYPAMSTAQATGGILGLHEYSSPYMWDLFTGTPQSGSGWLTGRYRKVYQTYFIPAGLVIPLVITENGIDGGTCSATGCDIAGGYKNFCSYWTSQGNGTDCDQTYLDGLSWYDSVIRNDSYVLGSTIFCIEIPNWDDFDISTMTDKFINYLQSAQL